jgi:WD40 repeat protein/Flp pilus assembly protein TadD
MRKNNHFIKIWMVSLIGFVLALSLVACGDESSPGSAGPSADEPALNAADLNKQSLEQIRQGNFEEAIATLSEAIALDPEFANAYHNRGEVYYKLDNYEQAIADYTTALELKPNNAVTYQRRGLAYFMLGNSEQDPQIWEQKALPDYERAIELDPKDAEAYMLRAWLFGNLGKMEEAFADWERAIELAPDDAQIYRDRGFAYGTLGDYERAIADYMTALELEPDHAQTYLERAKNHNALGNIEEVIADLETYLELAPDAPDREAIEAAIAELTTAMTRSDTTEPMQETNTNSNKTEFALGEPIEAGFFIVTINSVSPYQSDDSFAQPEPGNQYMVADITVENLEDKSDYFLTHDQLYLIDEVGQEYTYADYASVILLEKNLLFDEEIGAGKQNQGLVPFEVAEKAEGLLLVVDTTPFDEGGEVFVSLTGALTVESPTKMAEEQLSLLHKLTGPTSGFKGVTLSLNGQMVAAGAEDGSVWLWQVQDGQLRHSLEGHTDRVGGIAFSPNGELVVSGGWDGQVNFWQVDDGELRQTIQINHPKFDIPDAIWDLAYSPDGRFVAVGGSSSLDGLVQLIEVGEEEIPARLEGHTDLVYGVAFSPDNQILASASYDSTVSLWRVSDGSFIRTLEGALHNAQSVAFSPDGEILAVSMGDQTVQLWQVDDGMPLHTLAQQPYNVLSIAFSPNGTILANGLADGTIQLWQVSDWELVYSLKEHTDAIWGTAFSADGSILATASDDRTVHLWQVVSSK